MAFVRSRRRLPCSSYCGCDQMSQNLVKELVVSDFDAWAYHYGERVSPPQGIVFKYPSEYLLRRNITFRFPYDYAACVRDSRVDTLFELTFKVTTILCENLTRQIFSSDHGRVVNYHFRQFVLAHYTLVHEHNWPSKLALWLLPRLPTAHRFAGIYPPEIHHGICPKHIWFHYDFYLAQCVFIYHVRRLACFTLFVDSLTSARQVMYAISV